MIHLIALAAAAATAAPPIVSTDWLQAHLNDPQVRIIYVGYAGEYARAHIPGARLLELMQTTRSGPSTALGSGGGPGLAPVDALVRAFTAAGAADDARVVLYGDTPMAPGWVYMALASVGHG